MARRSGEQVLEIGGRQVKVANLAKPMFPVAGFTKGQVLDYYIRAAPYLLPHLKDRPVTLKRYPDGIGEESFYEKNAPVHTPAWVRTFPVPRRGGGKPIRYVVIDDLATLVWCANQASLEIHPFLHRAPEIQRPTVLAFDLDPGEGTGILACAEVAFIIRKLFERMKLRSFVKVSGSKGLQMYVPLNTPVTYDETQAFARATAEYLQRENPKLVVAEMAKAVRKRKVFIDWSQNSDFKTTVAVYSLRAKRQHPFVSLPMTWKELESAVAAKDRASLDFRPQEALERLDSVGDLWAKMETLEQHLPEEFTAGAARASRPRKSLAEHR